MAAYDTLRAAIDSYIKANGNNEITGEILNDILNAMVSALGADTRFAGVAVPSTNPGNPEGNVVYFASQAGTYSNFGGIVLPLGIHILVWNGTAWTSQTWFSVDNTPTQNSQNLVTSGGILQAIVDVVGVERLRAIGVEVTSASFNSTTKKISFFNSANSTLFQLDATAFIIDGMVSDVKIEDGNLVIKFNTDAGKQDIEIPLTDIFNPANYYTKIAIDALLALYYTKTETDTLLASYYTKTATNELLTAINNKLADGYLYRGIAEPTTNPPTPTTKVFYIATKAGTYTNFGNIAVTEGITILKYDGSNWSKEQISYSDGVFDISAYNGTSYADLSAALGTNGANIPQNLRKGGMSVKYVQSSDNKYVQWRLMSESFNTTVANWQGVDDEPTAESDNLVKSGSVAFEIGKLKSLLGTENEILSPTPAAQNPTGYAINFVTGSYTPYPYCSLTNPVTLNKGEGVVVIAAQYTAVCAMYKTNRPNDNYGTRVPLIEGVSGTANNIYIYAATTDNEYIGFGYITERGLKVYKVSSDVLKNIYNLIDEKQSEINEINADFNTISAEQDYVIKTVQTQAGTDAAIDIPLSIPKGEICLVKADWGDNISSDSTGIKLNEQTSVTVYAPKGQWTLIKPNVEVVKVYTDINSTFVVGTGDYSLTIKKLQSITKDGKLPLYNGGLSSNGDTWTNADRKNTRVILNDGPLYLYLSEGYEVAYMYGNEPDNLTEGGYISALNGGGETILNVDAKYIGFTIVKPSSATFDNLRFIVSNADSNDAKIIQTVNSIGRNLDDDIAELTKVANIGKSLDDGLVITESLVSGSDFVSKINIELHAGDIIRMKCENDCNIEPYCSLQYDDGSYLDASGQEKKYGSWYTFTLTKNTSYIRCVLNKIFVIASGNMTVSLKKVNPLVLREKVFQFMNTDTVSDLQYKIAMGNGFDISDDGILYGTITCASDGYKEYDYPTYVGGIVTANIADIHGTKDTIIAIHQGNNNWMSYPELVVWYITYVWGSKVVSNNFVNLGLYFVYNTDNGTKSHVANFIRRFNISTGVFENDVIPCDINVLGTIYPMETIFDRDTSTGELTVTAESQAMIEAIWTATGIEHPAIGGVNDYTINIGANIIKCPYDNYFYVPITLGNSSHALCKSLDLIHWIFVCDLPFNQISYDEDCICFATKGTERRIYALSRGQFGTDMDNKFGRIMYCDFDVLTDRDNTNWSEPIVLHNWNNERPTITELNGVLYLMGGLGQNATTEGISVPRGQKSLVTMDLDLNIISRDDFNFTYPFLHFDLMQWSGQLWFYTASDKRCFFANHGGDTRNEISFARVDENILKM